MDHKIEVCNSNFDFFNKKKPENIINTEGIAKIKEQFIIKIITKIKEIKEIKGVEGVEGVEVIEKFEEVEEVDELKRFDLYNRLRTFLFDFYRSKKYFGDIDTFERKHGNKDLTEQIIELYEHFYYMLRKRFVKLHNYEVSLATNNINGYYPWIRTREEIENSIPKLHKKIDTILATGLDILKMIPENLPIVI